jgi:hypothetical protein
LSKLREAGWELADIDAAANDPWSYQAFNRRSKAEFGIATPGYIVTHSGWFSQRSAGIPRQWPPSDRAGYRFFGLLPCGAGLFAFRSVNDIAAAVAELDAHYEAHCRSAPIGLLIGFKPTDT